MQFPDSPLARAADELLRAACAPTLVAHCHRTYHFGMALLENQRRAVDAEAVFIAAALHDLALTSAYDDPTVPFQAHGARLAQQGLLARGAGPDLAELVHDAIALHLELTSATDPRPEVVAVHLGAVADVVGARLDQLTPRFVADVLDDHPRHGFTAFVTAAFGHEAAARPDSRIAVLVRDHGLLDLVAAAPFED
ncbi:hypothetical protein Lfu02_40530 [Longispora fulva]|uniref:HD domain-containing protein n=1 Tax=Longispora fulva TaxID=619741 RepID=A0A8J7KPN7_9ACTN|nr:metal-dependent phosphohydrolase [Longispora fulva]MBG6136512.1 hypothetical protein [Longispora fulva]GIG59681.1 hypothetical protein Lfu02_40530 [Longispora fulva]